MSKKIEHYKDLVVWQKSMKLAEAVYRATEQFPEEERYGLVAQMRRCAVSIPSNIAEGRGRRTWRDYIRFLRISYSSCSELETQLELSKRLGFIQKSDMLSMETVLVEVLKMLNKMIATLVRKKD